MAHYKLVSYLSDRGPRAGTVIGDTLYDTETLTGNPAYSQTLGLLAEWGVASGILDSLAAGGVPHGIEAMPLSGATLLAPVLYPSALYCAGANYTDHMIEMARLQNAPAPDPRAAGQKPWHFLKAPRSMVGDKASVHLPAASRSVDWEVELAAVIGHEARNVPAARALEHVAGYTVANDLSARDLSRRPEQPESSPFRFDWIGHKSFDGACPIGPWIVPAKAIADPQALGIKLWVNDAIKQESNTGSMVFTLAEQIEHLSSRMTLYPGDIILTGTPAGVGAARREFLKPGDVTRAWIENIGTLTTRML